MKADLVVFDPARVRDLATFEKPHQYAEGISRVITNGQVVFEGGAMTAARPGAVLYGPGRATGGADVDPPLPALPRADPRERRRLPALRPGTARGAAGPPPEPNLELVPVFRTVDAGLVALAKSLLEGEGIEYMARGEGLQDLFGWGRLAGFNPVVGPVEFVVRSDDAPRVRALLRDLASVEEARPSEDAE